MLFEDWPLMLRIHTHRHEERLSSSANTYACVSVRGHRRDVHTSKWGWHNKTKRQHIYMEDLYI